MELIDIERPGNAFSSRPRIRVSGVRRSCATLSETSRFDSTRLAPVHYWDKISDILDEA